MERLGIAAEIERFDRNDVPLDGKGAEQQLGEPAGLLGVGIGPSALGNVARDPGQRLPGGLHHLVHVRRGREEPGKVSHCQLDTIEDLGQRHQVAQLGQPSKRLHPADDVIEWLPVGGGSSQGSGGPIEGAGDECPFTRDERPDAGV